MKKKINWPKQDYLNKIINEYPSIISGRKNYNFFYKRIKKNIKLTLKFYNKD